MPSRDPVDPDATNGDVAATSDALTLAEAEANAAEAEAQAARARARLLKLKQESAHEDLAVAEHESDAPITDADQPAEQARVRGGIWKPLRWAAATLAVLAIGGIIAADMLMLVHHRGVEQRRHQAAEYAAAARQAVVTLMALDYQTVDDAVKRIIDNSTGEFRKDFESHTDDFIKVARQSKTITEATATVAGVESMTATEAVVLVAANTKVTNAAGAKQEPRNWRLTVHLTREGDQIKMSKVDFAT